jgi:ATP-dependent DNA ligase
MLQKQPDIGVRFYAFDVLAVGAEPTTRIPYRERRALLESLTVNNRHVQLVTATDDGPALVRDDVRARPRGCCRETRA